MIKLKIYNIFNNLSEEFYKGFEHSREGYVEIFKNPELGEIRDVIDKDGNLRFYASSYREDLYIWNPNILHYEIAKQLGVGEMQEYGIESIAELRGNKVIYDIDWYQDSKLQEVSYEILEREYDWLKRYSWDIKYLRDSVDRKLEELNNI